MARILTRKLAVLRRTALLLAVTAAAGTAANLFGPYRIPWQQAWSRHVEQDAQAAGITLVNIDQVRAIVAAGNTVILDARPASAYDGGHLPGALSLPEQDAETLLPQYLPVFAPDAPILVYCAGASCDESLQLAYRLTAQGITNVLLYAGGYAEWSAAEPGGGT